MALGAVAVARSSTARSIGLDIEADEPMKPELRPRILTDGECAWLETRDAGEQGRLAMLVFSAKECFYKCQHPLTRQFLGFQDVELELDPDERRFVARPRVALDLDPAIRFEGGWDHAEGHVLTAMALARE